jgi:hypothetical protein
MLRKFLRLLYTLRYIKGIQLRYQLWYRVKNRFISIHRYKKYLQRNFIQFDLQVVTVLQSKQKEYHGNNRFEFIGLQQSFSEHIDWNYQGHGKLWNYNLQYFSYLLDEHIPFEERILLLKDFSNQLLSATVKPEPYPVSLRVVNTLLFHSRYKINDPVILEALQKQIDFLVHNLEYHLLANHLLENSYSIFISSIYLSDQALYAKSYKLLKEQLEEQILEDGGHYECSPMYQSILLSKLLLCIEVARNANWIKESTLGVLEEKAAKMLGWINQYSFPDGSWALMNDSAEKIAPTTEALKLAASILNIKPVKTKLSSSGFRKFSGDDWELLIKAGPVQPDYQPGHIHADISSYCLWYKGRQVIVDPGISTYAISDQRNIERGTGAHNTLSINSFNQSDVWAGFRVGKRAFLKINEDSENGIKLTIQPYFDRQCVHTRKIKKANDSCFIIKDEIYLASNGTHHFKGNIQFSAGIPIKYQQDEIVLDTLSIKTMGISNGLLTNGEYAQAYHKLQQGLRFSYRATVSSSFTFQF